MLIFLSRMKKIPWRDIVLVALLMLFDMSIHPLTLGPDRRIHDPAVYRLVDTNYLPGDWYTDMAVASGVYMFYSKLIHASQALHLPEELWRLGWYLVSLALLYYSLIRIARLFSPNVFVIPLVAGLHALMITSAPPIWLYGPFLQIDGGLAPRSIGMALSFLAFFFLLKNSLIIPATLLGLATLIHVSNSLIIFTLFFAAWLCQAWIIRKVPGKRYWLSVLEKAVVGVACYILTGGWFALYVARLSSHVPLHFPTVKFIWSWIYFRAPYMALPLLTWRSWLLFTFHILAIVIGWYLLRKKSTVRNRVALNMMGLVGLGAIVYFFIFYLFTFIYPWLPGFQFYSIRVIYLAYFIAYLVISVLALTYYEALQFRQKIISLTILLVIGMGVLFLSAPGQIFLQRLPKNIRLSWQQIGTTEPTVPTAATAKYLFLHPEPFLAPPHWYGSSYYLPSVASFKSFGFTPTGLEEWYQRLNDVSGGELEKMYQAQSQSGAFRSVTLDWPTLYSQLSKNEILTLSEKYHFRLFLTYQALSYPFPLIAEDGDWRLYQVH